MIAVGIVIGIFILMVGMTVIESAGMTVGAVDG